jgi:two-component system heavy metal sensor histidine kinase CusS
MTAADGAYSLLKRLSLAFTIVAILVLSLAGALLYHSLSSQLMHRDDSEISVQLDGFLAAARGYGSAAAVGSNSDLFREELLTHPAISFAILDGQGRVLADSGRRDQSLQSIGPGNPAEQLPYSCSPPSIGPSRCVFGDEKLVS